MRDENVIASRGGESREKGACDLAKCAIKRMRREDAPRPRARSNARGRLLYSRGRREQSKRFANGFHGGKALVLVSRKIQFSC